MHRLLVVATIHTPPSASLALAMVRFALAALRRSRIGSYIENP